MAPDVAALILAAGKGTRMRSSRPKVLFEVGGRPMVAWALERARGAGANPAVVVVGHAAESVEAAVADRFPEGVRFALQAEQLGTGHAAKVGLDALEGFEGHVLILSGDVPLLTQASVNALLAGLAEGCPVALLSTELDDPTGYGRVLRTEDGVARIVEHKDASEAERAVNEVNAGIYAVEASFLRSALGRIGSDNAQSEYYLTDIVELALRDGHRVSGIVVGAEEVMGANDRAQLANLERLANARTIRAHLAAGVGFVAPELTRVGPDVEIGADALIHPGVHLRGHTKIGAGAVIDVGCVLTDAEVGPGVTLHPYSVLESARVDEGGSVGPFARLRPEAHLEAGARVGNFVEVKKSTLGKGAKANHLAYIGDAHIGAGANVGAGTITCNYDGTNKHPTRIGDGTFIGSNSTLVAPVDIGAQSYVAAGSVITEPVPGGSLSFGRARQTNKEGRAAEVRAAAAAEKARRNRAK